jgi:hypothetical protein
MQGKGWENFGPKKKKHKGQHEKNLTVVKRWLM